MQRIQIYLPPDLVAMLQAEAKDRGVNRSEVIRTRLHNSYKAEQLKLKEIRDETQDNRS